MFGYVRPDSKNLRLRDHECYRALYCGLCRSMGRCTGQCSRLSLSYDFTFLAALRASLSGEEPKLATIHCGMKCGRKKQAFRSPSLDFCAYAAAILGHYKILDDKADERGLRRLRAAFLGGLFRRSYRRAKRRYPELDLCVKEHMEALAAIEREGTPSIDRPAERFGLLLGDLAAFGLADPASRLARAIGQAVGRWIYLVDAADDYDEDKKRGRYNPFLAAGVEWNDEEKATLSEALAATLIPAENALALVDSYPAPEFREILQNLLFGGLPATADRVLNRKSPKRSRNEQIPL